MAYQCNSEKRQEEDDRSKTASECKKKATEFDHCEIWFVRADGVLVGITDSIQAAAAIGIVAIVTDGILAGVTNGIQAGAAYDILAGVTDGIQADAAYYILAGVIDGTLALVTGGILAGIPDGIWLVKLIAYRMIHLMAYWLALVMA